MFCLGKGKNMGPLTKAVALTAMFSTGTVLSGCGANTTSADTRVSDQPTRPVIVELFTSEGCSSCPPADALLARLDKEGRIGNAEIIALEEHVDYWDQLGWRDPFSGRQWTERQEDYANVFGNAGVYTPQMVVDGRVEFVGSAQNKARNAIAEAAKEPKAEVAISEAKFADGKLQAGVQVKMFPAPLNHAATVWIAVTESGLHSNVKAGENAGEDLHHASVVRSLRKAGEADSRGEIAYSSKQELQLDPTWKRENLRLVVFVQDSKSRHILGAASARLTE